MRFVNYIGVDPTKTPFTKFTVTVNNMRSTAGESLFTSEYFVFVEAIRLPMGIVPFQCFEAIYANVFKQGSACCIKMVLGVRT